MNSATKILDDVYRTDGYSHASCSQGYKVIEEIYYCINREVYYKNHPDKCLSFLKFCDKHLIDVVDAIRNKSAEDVKLIASSFAGIPIESNPFTQRRRWKSYSTLSFSSDNALDLDEIDEDYNLAEIARIAHHQKGGRKNFLFAQDSQRNEYFIHFNAAENCDWNDWLKLQTGTQLAVIDSERVEGKTARNVKRCLIVNA